jgi:formate dehydrogenase
MAKVLCVLYTDPVGGYSASYARDEIPQMLLLPGRADHTDPACHRLHPGELLGSVSGSWACAASWSGRAHAGGHLRQGRPDSVFERELVDADIAISPPFWRLPDRERM